MISELSAGYNGCNVYTTFEFESDDRERFFREFDWWLEGLLVKEDISKIEVPGIPSFTTEGVMVIDLPYGAGTEVKSIKVNAFCVTYPLALVSVCLLLEPIYKMVKKDGWEATMNEVTSILIDCNVYKPDDLLVTESKEDVRLS